MRILAVLLCGEVTLSCLLYTLLVCTTTFVSICCYTDFSKNCFVSAPHSWHQDVHYVLRVFMVVLVVASINRINAQPKLAPQVAITNMCVYEFVNYTMDSQKHLRKKALVILVGFLYTTLIFFLILHFSYTTFISYTTLTYYFATMFYCTPCKCTCGVYGTVCMHDFQVLCEIHANTHANTYTHTVPLFSSVNDIAKLWLSSGLCQ